MTDWLQNFDPAVQALLAGLFTWSVTAVGAAGVFLRRTIDRRFLDAMLGFSGGVMIAASYWSLLAAFSFIIGFAAMMALDVGLG